MRAGGATRGYTDEIKNLTGGKKVSVKELKRKKEENRKKREEKRRKINK